MLLYCYICYKFVNKESTLSEEAKKKKKKEMRYELLDKPYKNNHTLEMSV